jgi:hypothetical protein
MFEQEKDVRKFLKDVMDITDVDEQDETLEQRLKKYYTGDFGIV